MKHIGLLMVNEENDILARTLAHNLPFVDALYVLDGDAEVQGGHCTSEAPIPVRIWSDAIVAEDTRFPEQACDGYRQFLLEQAVADHGPDNWFLLLHGDELWTQDPREITSRINRQRVAVVYNLPFFIPRDGEPWDYDTHPIDQLHWQLGPGWPEVRMFRGAPGVRYRPDQHFNVTPDGIELMWYADAPILHYPYRSPEQQAKRAQVTFDPDNYRQVGYWTDEMIREQMSRPQFRELTSTLAVAA